MFTGVYAGTASLVSPAQSSKQEMTSNSLAAVMCDTEDPCQVNTAYEPESSFTTSPRKPTRPFHCLKLLFQFRILSMTEVHERCMMNRLAFFLCLLKNVLIFYLRFSPS